MNWRITKTNGETINATWQQSRVTGSGAAEIHYLDYGTLDQTFSIEASELLKIEFTGTNSGGVVE